MIHRIKVSIRLRIVFFIVVIMGLSLPSESQGRAKKFINDDFGHYNKRRSTLGIIQKMMNKDGLSSQNVKRDGNVATKEFGNEALDDDLRWDDVWIDH